MSARTLLTETEPRNWSNTSWNRKFKQTLFVDCKVPRSGDTVFSRRRLQGLKRVSKGARSARRAERTKVRGGERNEASAVDGRCRYEREERTDGVLVEEYW